MQHHWPEEPIDPEGGYSRQLAAELMNECCVIEIHTKGTSSTGSQKSTKLHVQLSKVLVFSATGKGVLRYHKQSNIP